MRVETAAEAFADYRKGVVHPDASDAQVTEVRRAFYAGAYFMIMNLAYNIGDESTSMDEGLAELEKIKAELEAFGQTGGMPLPAMAPPEHVFPDAPAAPALKHMTSPPPTDHQYTGPDAAELRETLNELGSRIGSALPLGYGFCLLLFNFGDAGGIYYISNAERAAMHTAMLELIRKQTQ